MDIVMNTVELRIIIIDDNPHIHQDVIKVLRAPNKSSQEFEDLDAALYGETDVSFADNYLPEFTFDTATQGQEGVKKIKRALKEGRPYALAFVDIRMPPGWDGIETIRRIWKTDPHVQIVICTAFSDYNWEETIEKLGISDNFLILKKPFDTISVRQLACALTQKWLLAKESKQHMETLNTTVKEKTATLQSALSLVRATLESTAEGVLLVDLKRKIIDYNQRFINLFDIPKSLIDYHDENMVQELIADKIIEADAYLANISTLHKKKKETNQQTIHLKRGEILELTSQPHYVGSVITGRVFSFHDITERSFMEEKLEHQATHDDLTDLPNRVLLHDRIQQAIAYSARNKTHFAVLFFDLDRFKLVNDSLGHECGDKLLSAVAKRMSSIIRNEDTLSRLGGDEFVILLPGLQKEEDVLKRMYKIIQSFEEPFDISGSSIILTTSIGISFYPSNGNTVSTLLKNADLAMYQAKELGGNQFKYYTHKLNEKSQKKLQLEISLREALKNNEFFLLYQPQLDITDQAFLSVEALIRWQHPKKGIVLPLSFIPAAEECGLIIPIGEWVIREACKQIKAWHDDGFPYISIAVNVAAGQLKQPNLDTVINDILQEYQISPARLEIEITENVIINHADVIKMLNKLKKLGLKIALDDFGAGNSSLNYLKQIHVDRLKIDRSFIKNISISHSDEVIIAAIIAMSKNMSFKVLAEGVDKQNQIDFLKGKFCDEVQGFFYSQPLKPSAVIDFIKSHQPKTGE